MDLKQLVSLAAFIIFSLGGITTHLIGIKNLIVSPGNVLSRAQNVIESTSEAVLGSWSSNRNSQRIFISANEEARGAGGVISIASNDEPSVIIDGNKTGNQFTVDVYEANADDVLEYLRHDKDGKQKQKSFDVSDMRLVVTKNHDIGSSQSPSSLLLPLSESGIWLLKISQDSLTEYAFVVRSRFGVVNKEGDNQFIFWGQDFATGKKVTHGSIKVYSLLEDIHEITQSTFNDDGIATASLSTEADVAIVDIDGDKAIIPINLHYLNTGYSYRQFQTKKIKPRMFLFTDRPLYKPGDTVYFKTILRDDDDAKYTIPGGQVTVAIGDGWDNKDPIFKKTYQISSDGTIDGEMTLPEDAKTGYYSIAVKTPDGGIQNSWYDYDGSWISNSASFQVEYYRKPEYSLDVDIDRIVYLPGETARFTISGKYFSGHPLGGQSVSYNIYRNTYYEYDFVPNAKEFSEEDIKYHYWGEQKAIKNDGVILDANGEAAIPIELKGEYLLTTSGVLTVEASFKDESGNPVLSRKNILVRPALIGLYQKTYNYSLVTIGKEFTRDFILKPYEKATSIAKIPFTVSVTRTQWVKYQDPNQKYPSWKEEHEFLPNLTVTSNSTGDVSLKYTPQKVGSYKFDFSGKDSEGNTLTKSFNVWVTANNEPLITDGGKWGEVFINAGSKSYDPTNVSSMDFIITTPLPDQDVLLTIERGRVRRYKVISVKGTSATVEEPIISLDVPNIHASVSLFSEGEFQNDSINVPILPTEKKLLVTTTADKAQYGPGETVRLNVRTTNAAGTGESADVAIWAVDKALFELAADNTPSIMDIYWFERSNSTQLSHSLEGITVLSAEGGGGCFASGTLVLMADGKKKPIESIKPGEAILTRKSVDSSELVKTMVMKTIKAQESGVLVINTSLRLTADHILFVNNTWKTAGDIQIGDTLINEKGESIYVSSIEWLGIPLTVYNLEIAGYHTFFADEYWVHNQKGDVRSVLKDTAYWNPSVRTDSAGNATVSFKLPDNLTTWVVSAVGATSQTHVGQSKQDLLVTKDVIVRPMLPNILRIGDSSQLSTYVHNFTDKEETFTVNLDFTGGEVKQATVAGIIIPAKSQKLLHWIVKPTLESDSSRVTVAAWSDSNSKANDAITVPLPVRDNGFWDITGKHFMGDGTYDVKLAGDVDVKKSTITVSLASNALGTLPEAMKYLVGYPYGCVEQTTSRLIPTVLAKLHPDIFPDILNDKDLSNALKKGIKRLEEKQHQDGGWAWWDHGNSDVFVTVYVVEALLEAKKAGVTMSDSMLTRAKQYLERERQTRQGEQTLSAGELRDERIMKTYALSLLESSKGKQLLSYFNGQSIEITPDILSLAVMANVRNGDRNPNTNGLSLLESFAKTQGDGVYWDGGSKVQFGSKDASTALAVRALLAAGGDKELIGKALYYLQRSRMHDYWSNTFATVSVIRAILTSVDVNKETIPNYSYSILIDGKTVATGVAKTTMAKLAPVTIPVTSISKNGSTISIQKQGDGELYSLVTVRQYRKATKDTSVQKGISLTRQYQNSKGDEYTIGVGDSVDVKLTISGLGSEDNYGLIEDNLPAGLIPINKRLNNESQDNSWYYGSYGITDTEFTENGAHLSLYRVPSGTHTYTYQARAVSAGDYHAPPATVVLMYSPEIYGRSEVTNMRITAKTEEIPAKMIAKSVASASKKLTPQVIALLFVGAGVILLLIVGIVKYRIKIMIRINDIGRKFSNVLRRKKPMHETDTKDSSHP